MIESVHAAVPMIVIGSEIDLNIAYAVKNGFAFFLPEDQIDLGLDVVLTSVLNNDW